MQAFIWQTLTFGLLLVGTAAYSQQIETRPHTIRGRATNHEGKPVGGSKIVLVSANRIMPSNATPVLAETISDGDGNFLFRDVPLPVLPPDPGPIRKHQEGVFQVYGIAEGYGFTWGRQQHFRPQSRPRDAGEEPGVSYTGEEAQANLAFDLPAVLFGRLTNDLGKPLAGVQVQLKGCEHLDDPPPGGKRENNLGRIQVLPEELRAAVTDAEGRYRIGGLRRETRYSTLIDVGPDHDPLRLNILTSRRAAGAHERSLGFVCELDHEFASPREVLVKAIAATSGQSLAGVTVRARGSRTRRTGNLAKTDVHGMAHLRLTPDKYALTLEPPIDAPFVVTLADVSVSSDRDDQTTDTTEVVIQPAAVVLLKAVEAASGKPIGGVSFLKETESGTNREELQSQTAFVDYPATSAKGELRAMVRTGRIRFVVENYPRDFEPVSPASKLIELAPGEPHSIVFEFRRAKTPVKNTEGIDEDLVRLGSLIEKQQVLTRAGRYKLQYTNSIRELTAAELHALLADCDPFEVPDLPALAKKRFPKTDLRYGETTVVVDETKRRNESVVHTRAERGPTALILAFNGRDTIMYDEINAQASIYFHELYVVGLPEICQWQSRFVGPVNGQEPTDPPRVRKEKGRLVVELETKDLTLSEVFDERTGFLYRSSLRLKSRDFGSETWQFAPQEAPSGGIIAGMSVQYSVRNSSLSGTVARVLEFSLDKPPPDAFVVSVEPGTNIVDFRGNPTSPKRALVTEPITDVVTRANQIPEGERSILPVLKVGQAAPPLAPAVWLNASGETPAPDLKGKVVLVDFWGTNCGPCIRELPEVQEFHKQFTKQGIVVVGIHNSGVEVQEISQLAREHGLTYQLAIDRPEVESLAYGAAFKAYGIRGIPNCAVIDRLGKAAYIGKFQTAARVAAKLLEKKDD